MLRFKDVLVDLACAAALLEATEPIEHSAAGAGCGDCDVRIVRSRAIRSYRDFCCSGGGSCCCFVMAKMPIFVPTPSFGGFFLFGTNLVLFR